MDSIDCKKINEIISIFSYRKLRIKRVIAYGCWYNYLEGRNWWWQKWNIIEKEGPLLNMQALMGGYSRIKTWWQYTHNIKTINLDK